MKLLDDNAMRALREIVKEKLKYMREAFLTIAKENQDKIHAKTQRTIP